MYERLPGAARGSSATPPARSRAANLSVKVSALTPLLRPEAPEVGERDAARRLRPLLDRARERGVHLHIDMESLDSLETTMQLVFDLLDEPELRGRAVGGHRPPGLPARLARAARPDPRLGGRHDAGARRSSCGS